MMWWYLSDLSRFKQERMALATLAEGAPWLTPLKLTHDKTWRLIFEADSTLVEPPVRGRRRALPSVSSG
jgi:hypothetical protein